MQYDNQHGGLLYTSRNVMFELCDWLTDFLRHLHYGKSEILGILCSMNFILGGSSLQRLNTSKGMSAIFLIETLRAYQEVIINP